MGRPVPVVKTGMKQLGRDAREDRQTAVNTKREVGPGIYARISALLKGKQPQTAPTKQLTPWDVVFQSKYRRHRIQIDSPADVIDARGRKTMGRTLFAQFDNWHWSIPRWIKKLDEANFILDILRNHPAFNQDFWEEKDNSHEIRVAQVARVVAMLEDEKNKDIKETLLDYISERDFVDPALDGLGAAAPEGEDMDALEAGDAEPEEPVRRKPVRKPVKPSAPPKAKPRRRSQATI